MQQEIVGTFFKSTPPNRSANLTENQMQLCALYTFQHLSVIKTGINASRNRRYVF